MRGIARATALLGVTLLQIGAAGADGDPARGEARFQDCAACHKLEAGINNVGPSLNGVLGRKAGEISDFRYSPAIKLSGITWTPETLDKFIADPQGMMRPSSCHCKFSPRLR